MMLLKFVGLQAINAPLDMCARPQNSAGNACVPSTNVSLHTLPLQGVKITLMLFRSYRINLLSMPPNFQVTSRKAKQVKFEERLTGIFQIAR